MDTDAKPPQQSTAAPPGSKRWVQALQMFEGSPEKRLHELRGPYFVGMRETVPRRRNRPHPRQGCRFQPQPVAEVIQPQGVRQLRENHRAQVAVYGKVPRFGLRPGLSRYRPDQRSRNMLERLFENDNIRSGWRLGCFFHPPTVWQGSKPPPAHFFLTLYGMAVYKFHRQTFIRWARVGRGLIFGFIAPCHILGASEPETPCQLIPMLRLPVEPANLVNHLALGIKLVTRSPGSATYKGESMRKSLTLSLNSEDQPNIAGPLPAPWDLYFPKDYARLAPRSSAAFMLVDNFNYALIGKHFGPSDRAVITTKEYWGSEAVVETPNANSVLIQPGAAPPNSLVDETVQAQALRPQGSEVRATMGNVYVSWSGTLTHDVIRGPVYDLALVDFFVTIEIANPGNHKTLLGNSFLSPKCWTVREYRRASMPAPSREASASLSIRHDEDGVLEIPSFARVPMVVMLPDEVIIQGFKQGSELEMMYAGAINLSLRLRRQGERSVEILFDGQ